MAKVSVKRAPSPERSVDRLKGKGASIAKVGVQNKMDSWRAHHAYSAKISLRDLLASPLQSIMIGLVIAIALSLPGALLIVIDNVQALGERWNGGAGITVFLEQNVSPSVVAGLNDQLAAREGMKHIEYISPEQALEEFGQASGFADVLSLLDENPLPGVFLLQPDPSFPGSGLPALLESLRDMEGIAWVQMDLEWVQKLDSIMSLAQRITSILSLVLVLGIVLSVGNTISLAIESRRDEIVVSKLVGATDAFVRRPFLYTGVWYGLAGGIIAVGLLFVMTGMLDGPVSRLSALYQSDFELSGLDLQSAALMLLASLFLGYGGAWLAVSRHLHDIQPR
ncbi:MAG: permease-like cell division protein FtsX [Pseudomonadales bacterium]|nr:permease-like cell division protein FtsX [Pseudomonadales bacterium]